MTDLPSLPETVFDIHGYLSPLEAETLYQLAASVPAGGNIVEIGSYQGRSTVCLGLGAKHAGARVYAIDPHEDCQASAETHYGMENHAALLHNLVSFELAQTVLVIGYRSVMIGVDWSDERPVHLLWIDGSHEYADVLDDLRVWQSHVDTDGKIALHDTSGHFPDVERALETFLKHYSNRWRFVDKVDAITLLERV